MRDDYVHGYSNEETNRLRDQANTLANLMHDDTKYPAGSKVLEEGCGVGAQTVMLAKNSPEAHITSIDISEDSIKQARSSVEEKEFSNVKFQQADIYNLPFEDETLIIYSYVLKIYDFGTPNTGV